MQQGPPNATGQRWLEPSDPQRPPVDLLRPYDADEMKAWRSDTAIDNVRNTGQELGSPLMNVDDEQRGLF